VPLFPERWPVGPAPPVRNDGLFPTAGRPDPEPPDPPAGPLVAIAVGKTKDGESFPAKPKNYQLELDHMGLREANAPSLEYPVPL